MRSVPQSCILHKSDRNFREQVKTYIIRGETHLCPHKMLHHWQSLYFKVDAGQYDIFFNIYLFLHNDRHVTTEWVSSGREQAVPAHGAGKLKSSAFC